MPINIIQCIKATKEKTTAVFEVNHHVTKSVDIRSGVGDGWPLSALIFILAVEPLLLDIKNDHSIKTSFVTKESTYADDTSCYVKRRSLAPLFESVQRFCEATQLSVKVEKTDIRGRQSIEYHTTQRKSKYSELTIF